MYLRKNKIKLSLFLLILEAIFGRALHYEKITSQNKKNMDLVKKLIFSSDISIQVR